MLASCFPLNKLAIAFILSMTDSSSPARLDSSTSIFPLILAVSFFSGLAALVYEISWSRQLESLFGHTANAAAVVLTAYFGGMAIGNAIGGRLASRMCAFRAYAICEFFIATGALAIPFVLNATIQSWHNDRFDIDNPVWQLAFRVLYSLTLLAPATIAMGASLPLMNEMVSHCFPPFDPRRDDTPHRLCRKYFWCNHRRLDGVFIPARFCWCDPQQLRGCRRIHAVCLRFGCHRFASDSPAC